MDTKTSLMNAAERFARKRGYNGFSYADLAREVGIRKASIHHHFPNKRDLAFAIMERYRTNFFKALQQLASEHPRAGDRLRAYIGLYRAAMSGGDTLCLCVAFSIGSESLSGAVLAEIELFHEDSVIWLTELFSQAARDSSIAEVGEPTDEAAACLATVEGAQLIARAATTSAPQRFERAIRQLERRLVAP